MNTTTVNTPTVNTTTLTAGRNATLSLNEGYFAKRNALDWVFAALVVVGCLYAFVRYSAFMDVYEKGILLGTIPAATAMGWFWRPLRVLMMVVSGFALLGIASYQVDGAGSLARAEQVFWLKYFLSSQSAILWMSVLFFMSTIFYWLGMFAKGQSSTLESLGSKIAWVAVGMALIGTLVRWYESYLIGADVGHIPVSNLYEVFVLFCWMTAAFYLYFEAQYNTRALGAFVMLVVSAAVGFLL
ncbi:MAG: c-type cytochrome biogenesis protein CcsB, partial [Polaromonas sp.]